MPIVFGRLFIVEGHARSALGTVVGQMVTDVIGNEFD